MHELEIENGVAKMAYRGQTPWHQLGVQVEGIVSTDEMMKAAGLDWSVTKAPLFAGLKMPNNNLYRYVKYSEDEALIRESDNKILDIVGKDWKPTQNKEAFDFFHEYVEAGEMEMETAGSLRGGKIVWAMAKFKSDASVIIGKQDKIEPYLLFTNPHQYGKNRDVRHTAVRVVCNNTLTMALRGKSTKSVTTNHRTAFDAEAVKKELGLVRQQLSTYKELGDFLLTKSFREKTLDDFLMEVFPQTTPGNRKTANDNSKLSRNAELAKEWLEKQPGFPEDKGTWWQAFNATTFLTNHLMGRNDDTRVDSLWNGPNAARNTNALQLAVKYANAA